MNLRPRFLKLPRLVAGLAVCLAGLLFFFTQKLGFGPGWNWRGGDRPDVNATQGTGGAAPSAAQATANPPPETPSQPLQITIDNARYLVGGAAVESVDELVKMALAVPKETPPPRVLIFRRPTARYTAEKKLIDALQAARVDFAIEK